MKSSVGFHIVALNGAIGLGAIPDLLPVIRRMSSIEVNFLVPTVTAG